MRPGNRQRPAGERGAVQESRAGAGVDTSLTPLRVSVPSFAAVRRLRVASRRTTARKATETSSTVTLHLWRERRTGKPVLTVEIVTRYTAAVRGKHVHRALRRAGCPAQYQHQPPDGGPACWTVPAREAESVAAAPRSRWAAGLTSG